MLNNRTREVFQARGTRDNAIRVEETATFFLTFMSSREILNSG